MYLLIMLLGGAAPRFQRFRRFRHLVLLFHAKTFASICNNPHRTKPNKLNYVIKIYERPPTLDPSSDRRKDIKIVVCSSPRLGMLLILPPGPGLARPGLSPNIDEHESGVDQAKSYIINTCKRKGDKNPALTLIWASFLGASAFM